MKRLIALIPLLLIGCASEPKATDYSFKLTNEIITSSIEIDDDFGEYSSSCNRKGKVAYKLDIKPENFTGHVMFRASAKIGDHDEEEYLRGISVIDGKMRPAFFSFYSYKSSGDDGKFKAICSMKTAKDFEYQINTSSIVMLPGVHPSTSEGK